MTSKGVVVLAAGGTGGHLFPAEALANELNMRGYDVHLVTDGRAQRFVSYFADNHVHVIRSATIAGKNPFALGRTLWQLWQGMRQSRRLFAKLKPVLVVGFGGYPTLPPIYAASSMGIATFIHEQNAVMGRANRFLARRVRAIAGGFLSDEGEYGDKIVVTGNPVRASIVNAARKPYHPAAKDEPFSLLVFGGSQGASFFSKILPEALDLIDGDIRKRLHITQQARQQDADSLKQAYEKLRVKSEIAPFFKDMADRIAGAQYIIARSGASTVAEIAAIGRPALLVPYPYALDHDQALNAAALAGSGGVKVVAQQDLTSEVLARILLAALEDSQLLATMAASARQAGHLRATVQLANMAEALIAGKTVEEIKNGESA